VPGAARLSRIGNERSEILRRIAAGPAAKLNAFDPGMVFRPARAIPVVSVGAIC